MNRAALILLIGTPSVGHAFQLCGVQLCGQVNKLGRGDEEPMVVGGEIAAGSAGGALSGAGGVLLQL